MILKIKANGKEYGLRLYENNENGEIEIVESFDPDTQFKEINSKDIINQGDIDDIFGTNEQMIILKTSGDKNMEREKIIKAIGSEFIHQCPTCKSVLPKDKLLKYCPRCGQKISDGYKFIDLTDIGIEE